MKFSEIAGYGELKHRLIQTVRDQRVSHAQLFYGPSDSSKLALAIAYAQFINCTGKNGKETEQGKEPDSCGVCPSCVQYQKLVHPDLHFIFPVASTKKVTKNVQSRTFIPQWREFLLETRFSAGLLSWYEFIGIENKQGFINKDDCNEIIATLSYKSYESDYKVMIIWMPERIYPTAAPKILKILEEPPEKTLFLLVSEEPDQIISTILSRTLMVKVPRCASAGGGSEEDAVHFVSFREWMRNCFAPKIPQLIGFSTEISRTGREKQKSFLNYALKIIGDCAAFNYRQQLPSGISEDEKTFIRNFAPFIPFDKFEEFYRLFNDAIYHIERNAHAPTLFLDLSLKIVRQFKPNFLPL